MIWSADVVADDWKRISPTQVLNRAVRRLERVGRGILLLHDIHRRTAVALPKLLAALKQRRFQIVHIIPEISQEHRFIAAPSMPWVGTP